MRDVMLIERMDQAGALLNPLRLELIKLTGEPRTCAELAEAVGQTPQKIYYHVKVLERAGAIEKVRERRVRAITEGYYQATARTFWLSPRLVGGIGGSRRGRDQTSLLLALAEELQTDVGRLAETGGEAQSLGFSAQVRLARPADRTAFLTDVQNSIQSIAKKYGAMGPLPPQSKEAASDTYRLIFACYPRRDQKVT